MTKYNIKDVERIAQKVWSKTQSSQRAIVFSRGCKTYGVITEDTSEMGFKLCDDKECESCTEMRSAMEKAAEDYANET